MKLTFNEGEVIEAFANFISQRYHIVGNLFYLRKEQYDKGYDAFEVKEHFKQHLDGR